MLAQPLHEAGTALFQSPGLGESNKDGSVPDSPALPDREKKKKKTKQNKTKIVFPVPHSALFNVGCC